MLPTRLLAAILTLCLLLPAAGQEAVQSKPQKRPRIGVVLAGGSALGLSHVGALKWLEENRVPVDIIAGTSMGGLVAGIFATGRDYREIEQFVEGIDWNGVFEMSAPFPQLAFRRKEDQREYPNTIEFGWRKGLRAPSGLNGGHGVGLVISSFAAPYADMKSFDELPTPFRCVSADLVTANQVVFDSGSLPLSLRATMSLPAIFAPVRDGNRILVDGGTLNNLPVDVVRKLGADVIIAVALDVPPPKPEEIESLFGAARRSLSVMITANERKNIGLADLVLMPDLEGFTGGDFPRWKDLEQKGYEAAEKKRLLLSKFSVSEEEYARWREERRLKRRPETVRPQFVEVDGKLAPRLKQALVDAVGSDPAKPVERENLESELTKLTGIGRFDSASYIFKQRGEEEGLVLQLHEKPHGPPFIKPAITLDANRGSGIQFGIGARITFLDLGGPASEWRTDLSIGVLNRIATEYYYRINGGKWFVAPRVGYEATDYPIYDGKQRLARYDLQHAGGGADIGYAFGRFNEFRAGWSLRQVDNSLKEGLDTGDGYSGAVQRLRVRWVHEGQDSPFIPQRGIYATLEGSWVTDYPGISRQFPMADGRLGWAHSLPRRLLFIGKIQGGAGPNERPLYNAYPLGGPGQMGALALGQLLGNHFYYGGASLLRPLGSQSLSVFGRFYGMISYELGNAWFGPEWQLPRHSGALGLVGETPIGVVTFGGAIGDRGNGRVFFRLGRTF